MKFSWMLSAFYLALSLSVQAQDGGGAVLTDHQQAQARILQDVETKILHSLVKGGDPDQLLKIVGDTCNKTVTPSTMTVDDRLAYYKAAINCLEFATAASMRADEKSSLAIKTAMEPVLESLQAGAKEAKAQQDFLGVSFGVGFGISYGFSDAVEEAQIVNNVVRVTKDKREQPRALLEFHKFLRCHNGRVDGTRGCGPFVAVAASQDELLQGVGAGWMWGWKAKAGESDGFAIGIGAILDAKVKDLGSGFKDGEAPPPGETEVRYEEKSRWSGLLFFTKSF